ncbi:phage neck terminator protein [Ralstonia pseudosolanacearum]|uniref:phage neck terminator protein n=1 Tax=Ralstonia pseudosolanacearum TaxID=1310165 RepID=UPI003EE029F8
MDDSSTGGYLSPAVATPPLEDAALDAVFQQLIVGVTGLPGAMVRPRWQSTVPKQPEPSVNWCALGISAQPLDAGPAIVHNPSGAGADTYIRHQTIDVLATFYGPNSMQYAQVLLDGLAIPQNLEQLRVNDMQSVSEGDMRAAPEMFNEQWIRRYDVTLVFRRKITRTYPVLNVMSADVTLRTPSTAVPFSVNNPLLTPDQQQSQRAGGVADALSALVNQTLPNILG